MARGNSPRRMYDWGGFSFGPVTLTTTQAILGNNLLDIEPVTLVRSRGFLLIKGTPDAIADNAVVSLGLIVVSDNAAAVGGTSVPGPGNDPDAPWIWHQFVPLQAGSTGLLGDDIGSVVRVEIDSKAQRKLGINETLILVGETSSGTYSSITVNGGVRALAMHS